MNKVIFLSPVGFFKGGAERSLVDLVNNPNIEPIIIIPDNGPISEWAKKNGLKYYVVTFGQVNNIHRPFSFFKGLSAISSLLLASNELSKICNKENTTLIHSNGLKAHIINCVCRLLYNTRSIIHVRDIPYTKSEKIIWKLMQLLSDCMIIVSKPCWPFKNTPKNLRIVYNSTLLHSINDYDLFDSQGYIKLGFIGRIHPSKGLHLLLDWMALAKKNGLNLKLVVRGLFSEDLAGYQKSIYEQISKLDLSDSVTFDGFIDDHKELYAGIDIVVVPSYVPDPLPRSVMEAMSWGKIVFGYPSGGITEMIEDKKNGFLVKNQNNFIDCLNFIKSNKELAKSIKSNAQKTIEIKFNKTTQYIKLNQIYDDLVSH